MERTPSAQHLHICPPVRSSTAPTSASPPTDPGGLGYGRDAAAEMRLRPTTSQRRVLLLRRLVLKTDHRGDSNVRRGSHTRSFTPAVAAAAVKAVAMELGSAGVTKDHAERVGQVTSFTVTDVKGEAG